MKLLGFEFTIEHKAVVENSGPDSLSRWTSEAQGNLMSISVTTSTFLTEIRDALALDGTAQQIPQSIEKGVCIDNNFSIQQDLLYHQGRIFVPNSMKLRKRLLNLFHGSVIGGHSGEQKTYARLSANFYWPQMRREVQQHV